MPVGTTTLHQYVASEADRRYQHRFATQHHYVLDKEAAGVLQGAHKKCTDYIVKQHPDMDRCAALYQYINMIFYYHYEITLGELDKPSPRPQQRS